MRRGRSLATGLVLLAFGTGPALAEPATPVITVEGQASSDVEPDMARLSLGVVAERPTAMAATAEAARAAQAVVDGIKAEGIDDKDVVTTVITLTPVYPEEVSAHPNAPRPPRSFRASTELLVTIRPADRAGAVASRLVDKGANTIEGIDYSSSQEARILDGLRADAVRDAERQAKIYVGALGLRLGRVLEITPGGGGGMPPPPVFRQKSILAAPAPALPVKPGTLAVRADVSVRWEIAQ